MKGKSFMKVCVITFVALAVLAGVKELLKPTQEQLDMRKAAAGRAREAEEWRRKWAQEMIESGSGPFYLEEISPGCSMSPDTKNLLNVSLIGTCFSEEYDFVGGPVSSLPQWIQDRHSELMKEAIESRKKFLDKYGSD